MTKKEFHTKVSNSILIYFEWVNAFFLILLFASPFILIWGDKLIAYKVGLSGLIGVIIMSLVINSIKAIIVKFVDEQFSKKENEIDGIGDSKFMKRLKKQIKDKDKRFENGN